jgi:hypothetical protein
MPKDFLEDRKKALEDSFFAKENEKLLEQLRAKQRKKAARDGLAEVSGVSDPAVLDQLADLDIEPVTWTAISLIPLVEVAWADGQMDEKERRAVLAAAEANGVFVDSPSYALLQGWLERRPDGRLFQTWGEYIGSWAGRAPSPRQRAASSAWATRSPPKRP